MKLLVVDGTNVVMRCASVQTGVARDRVIASAGRMIRRAAEEFIHATHLVVGFDAPGPSFRSGIYPAYKAHRTDRFGESSVWGMEACLAFEATNVYCSFVDGFEADDIAATLAARIAKTTDGSEAHILSGDSDLLSLAGDRVHCWQFGRKSAAPGEDAFVVERTPQWICDRYGIASPGLLNDYKALVGEPGDNIEGVRGIGPKKAKAMLAGYGSIDGMKKLDVLGPVYAHAVAMRDLITLRTDVPIPPIKPSACRLPQAG